MKKTTLLRRLIQDRKTVILPGVYDCLSAKLAEQAGFEAILLTGAGIVASALGYPDIGLITMTEVLNQTRNIVKSVNIPVFADCDTGYGNSINVYRTVKEFEDAGVAGLFIEDQTFPKRCGHFERKQVISKEEMCKKIEAAVDARTDPDLIIMARTDARAEFGLEEAIERGITYSDAGAEMIFIEAPQSIEELRKIPGSIPVPTMANMVEGGKTPTVPIRELEEMGFKFVSFSGSAQKIAISAMKEFFDTLKNIGSVDDVLDKIVSLDERSRLLGLPRFYEMEKKYTEGLKWTAT